MHIESDLRRAARFWIRADDTATQAAVMTAKRPRPKLLLTEWTFLHRGILFPSHDGLFQGFPLRLLRTQSTGILDRTCEQVGELGQPLFQP